MSEKLTKSERLCSERQIDHLFSEGKWGRSGPLRYCWSASSVVETEYPTGGDDAAIEDVKAAGDAAAEGITPEKIGEVPVMVLFSVPKKLFKLAWKRNLLKRRMRESYRTRKTALTQAVTAAGKRIEIAFICSPTVEKQTAAMGGTAVGKQAATTGNVEKQDGGHAAKSCKNSKFGHKSKKNSTNRIQNIKIPDFKTIDDAVAKILEQIMERC